MSTISKSKRYTLNTWQDANIRLETKQGESGIKIAEFQLVDDKGVIDLTDAVSVAFEAQKPKSHACFIDCNIISATEGTVELTLETGITDIAGTVKGFVKVNAANGVLKFGTIYLEVSPTPDAQIEGSKEFSALDKALAKIAVITPEGTIELDDELTEDATNAVQGRAIYNALQNKCGYIKNINLNADECVDLKIIYDIRIDSQSYKLIAINKAQGGMAQFAFGEDGLIKTRYSLRYDTTTQVYIWSEWEQFVLNSDVTVETDNKLPIFDGKFFYRKPNSELGYMIVGTADNVNYQYKNDNCTEGDKYIISGTFNKGTDSSLALAIFTDDSGKIIKDFCRANPSSSTTYTEEIVVTPSGATKVYFSAFKNSLEITKIETSKLKDKVLQLKNEIDAMLEFKENSVLKVIAPQEITDEQKNYPSIKYLKHMYYTFSEVDDMIDEKADKDSINIYGYKQIEAEREHCFYSTSGVKTSNENYSSIKIDCNLGDKFYVTGYCMYSSQPLVVYFGAEGEFIGYEPFTQSTLYKRQYIEITDNRCKSVAFSSYNKSGSSVAQYLLCSKYGLLGSSLENAYLLAPMRGKSIYFDGDSVAVGFGSHNYSYADIIADKYEMNITQKAVSGTYLCTGVKANSIYERVMALNPATDNYDYIVLEGGFNDVFHFTSGQFGEVSDSYTDTFDSTKTVGAFEGICQHLTLNFADRKKLFILGHRKLHTKYTALQNELWDLLIKVCQKWGIPYIDLRSETSLGAYNDELAAQWFDNADGTHPNLKAYEKFYVPLIESKLKTL